MLSKCTLCASYSPYCYPPIGVPTGEVRMPTPTLIPRDVERTPTYCKMNKVMLAQPSLRSQASLCTTLTKWQCLGVH